MQVPCGKCLDCLRKYQNEWSNRMYEEYKAKGFKGVFFTLTYDEQHVPKNYLVDNDIFRSKPDYGMESRVAVGVRKKAKESPAQVLRDNGIFREVEIDFNTKRSPSSHQKFLGHLQKLFADYFAMTHRPNLETHPEDLPFFTEDLLDALCVDELSCDCSSFITIEETGELIPLRKKTYQSPNIGVFEYRFRPIISFNSVRKEDVQLWIRRNRTRSKRKDSSFDFSYFITSEYGPRTLRPHYHGVFFGVTKDDVKDWFKDWQEHYGDIVRYDDLDPTKGGLSYVSKYCSKGSYEHPLCCKDFFYFRHPARNLKDVRCSEYHSSRYEKCIQWFGIDAPIVDPTFHLVSKGLGVDWCNKDVIRCKEFDSLDFIPEKPKHDIEDLLSESFDLNKYIELQKEYEQKCNSVEEWFRLFTKRCCYERRFQTKKGEKVFSFALPSYYRSKMFSDNLRHSYSNFLLSENERLYREKLGQMDSAEFSREDSEKVLALERISEQELVDRFNARYDKFVKQSNRSQL